MKGNSFLGLLISIFSVFFLTVSCKKEQPKDAAAQMALRSYQHLVAEEYDAYLQGMAGYEQMPASYREELKALLAQYVRKEMSERGGFANITVNSDTIMGARANVFLQLEFKDGTTEEVSVPLIYIDESWRLQ